MIAVKSALKVYVEIKCDRKHISIKLELWNNDEQYAFAMIKKKLSRFFDIQYIYRKKSNLLKKKIKK